MYLILKLLARKIKTVRFRTIFGLALLHLVLTYFGFAYLGEPDLTASFISYAYYYTVTASTIGYGDMSPSSEYGQLFATLFLIPIAVSIFAALITKAIATMTNEIQKIKDVIEDTDVTYKDLKEAGMTDRIIDGIRALTKVPGQTYEEYKEGVFANVDAMKVKLADLRHNTDVRRLKGVSEKDIARMEKYHRFYLELTFRLNEAEK